jgi:hypothetical protein
MPEAPPVTSTILPSNRMISVSPFWRDARAIGW